MATKSGKAINIEAEFLKIGGDDIGAIRMVVFITEGLLFYFVKIGGCGIF